MIRFDATQVALSVIKFATMQLQHALDAANQDRLAFAHVRAARDRLHEACQVFENGDACEQHEHIYLPLFDALSLCTEAIRYRHWDRQMASKAKATLDALRTLIWRQRNGHDVAAAENRDRETSYRTDPAQEGGGRHA